MNLKISTSFMFDRATESMTTAQGRLSHTQAQLAASKQVLSPSDAPDQAASIDRLRQEIDRQNGHAATLQTALQRYTADPLGDLAAGRYDALVDAALEEAGLSPRRRSAAA